VGLPIPNAAQNLVQGLVDDVLTSDTDLPWLHLLHEAAMVT
jgi:hypothetical protein